MNRRLAFLAVLIVIGCVLLYWSREPEKNIGDPAVVEKPGDPERPDPKPEPQITVDDARDAIDKDEIKADVEYLASPELEGRMSGKKGNVLAAQHLKKKFEEVGLETMTDRFSIRRVNNGPNNETGDDFTENVYGWIEGSEKPDEVVVIGAHFDHIGYGPNMSRTRTVAIHPGADDNASGTAALIQIAEAFAKLKGQVKRTVVFQGYSAEEMGLIGSKHYCENPKFPRSSPSIEKHIFMLNMDMVGYLKHGQVFAGFQTGQSSPDIDRIITSLSSKYSFAKQITGRRTGGSDHANFYNKLVPIAFLHTGLHPHYHTPNDTADKLNYDGIEKVAEYGFDLAFTVAQGSMEPEFNYGEFEPMDLIHDHGHAEVEFLHQTQYEGVQRALLYEEELPSVPFGR